MSVKKLLEENRRIITGSAPNVNVKKFDIFVKEHGKDMALGYAMALTDVKKCLEEILIRRFDEGGGSMAETPAFVRKKNEHLRDHLKGFLKELTASGVLEDQQSSGPADVVQFTPP